MEELDLVENEAEKEKSGEEIANIISNLYQRKSEYETYSEEIRSGEETQKCLTDPESRLMMTNGKIDVCYNIQTAVDSKNKMIVEFDVGNNAQDKNQMGPMAEKAADVFGDENFSVVVDAGYDSATDIARCLLNGITPHVAGVDISICLPTDDVHAEPPKSQTNGRCVYLKDRNIAICSMGKFLYPGTYHKRKSVVMFYNTKACAACPCKCTTYRYQRFEIIMAPSEFRKDYNDIGLVVKQIEVTANKHLINQRKTIVEHPFGTIKRTMDAGYMLTKGKQGVSGELALTFLAYNFKRAINILGAKRITEAISTC